MTISTPTVSGQILTSAYVNNNINSGLVYVTTKTITAGSTTSTIASCFPTDYNSFMVNFNLTGTASGDVQVNLRVGSTTAAGADYSEAGYYLDLTGSSNFAVNGVNQTKLSPIAISAALGSTGQLTINNPNLAVKTTFASTYLRDDFVSAKFGKHNVATAYDQLVLTCSAGTFGGTVTVYGYRIA
jgi:hypothetical protein